MSYQIEFEERSAYLFARVTGEDSSDTVLRYMEDILRECEKTGCPRVLIHECLEGPRLSFLELFDLLSEGSRRAIGKFRAVALVDEKMGDTAEFAEDVAVNRGLPMRVFDDVETASQWISEKSAE